MFVIRVVGAFFRSCNRAGLSPSVGTAFQTIPLSRCSRLFWSFCLRVSGAVAPSAPVLPVSPRYLPEEFMKPVFLQLQCAPGKTYEVAKTLFEREIVSELYSTSGEFDLLAKIYIPEDQDIGKFINTNVLDISGIARSLTTLTFTAF
eukprot:gene25172-30212_t